MFKEGKIDIFERNTEDYCKSEEINDFILEFNPHIVLISQGHLFEGAEVMKWCIDKGFCYINFIPLVTEYHLELIQNEKIIKQNCYLLQQSNKILLDNKMSGNIIEKIFNQRFSNYQVITNEFDVPYYQKFVWNEPVDGIFKLAFFGRLNFIHKGIDLLLKVMAMEKWKKRKLKIFLYGHGPDEQRIIDFLTNKKISNIILCGYADNIANAIKEAHGVIFTSRMEGMPISLIDSLLCYRMAIVTPVGGMPDVVEDGCTGFISSSVTVSEIDKCLAKAWEKRFNWKEFGRAAGENIRKKISEFPSQQTIEIINDILKKHEK
jgi:glycosyltransferase involved in cell wall biosynthesis